LPLDQLRARRVAEASLVLNGRWLAAHTTGSDALYCAKVGADDVERQMRRVADALRGLAQRAAGDPARALLAHRAQAAAGRISSGRTCAMSPAPHRVSVAGVDARRVADLLDLDLEFLLFRHARTEEDVVASRGNDERIGFLHPLICGLPVERLEG
jgi:hypothetical protein